MFTLEGKSSPSFITIIIIIAIAILLTLKANKHWKLTRKKQIFIQNVLVLNLKYFHNINLHSAKYLKSLLSSHG